MGYTRTSIRARRVRCIETGVIYPSVCEVARLFGCTHPTVLNNIKGTSQIPLGYHFEYVDKGGDSNGILE